VSPAQLALFRDYPLGGQSMVKDLTEAPKLPDGVGVRPMTEVEYATWAQRLVTEYAQSFVDAGILTSEEATRRAQTQTENLLPQGQVTPEHSLLTLEADGSPAGSIWLRHNISPGTSYVFDVTVDENRRGKGLGRAVMLAGEVVSLAAGDSRLGLHVFGHNTVAMRLYESLGYEIVDQLRTLTIDKSA
jgi:ribosomal protein S18 acetylase RimI-like enzyme